MELSGDEELLLLLLFGEDDELLLEDEELPDERSFEALLHLLYSVCDR